MSPAAGVSSPSDRVPLGPMMMPTTAQSAPGMISEAFAKDAIIAWFRGEFAAANAIIDALCNHLTQLDGGRGQEYEAVFAAIHRRRLNWIQILQMQKYCSISDVALELRKVAAKKVNETDECTDAKKFEGTKVSLNEKQGNQNVSEEEPMKSIENGEAEMVDEHLSTDDSPKSGITDTGSPEAQQMLENMELCSNHEECEARRAEIKMTKGFVAKEPVKGHTVNVVRGLKLYDDVFTDIELSKLTDFVGQLRVAGQNGELSGDTFIMYNQQQSKKNKRELIQLGAPIFGHIKEDASSQTEPIPTLLQGVVDHLVQWNLISENRKPNSCIINFFDEGEYSQPFQKPPHLVMVDGIGKLWGVELEDKVLAAPEYCHANFTQYFTNTFWSDVDLSKTFGGRNPCYFNTGVMVMDVDKWRQGGYTQKVEEWMAVQKQKRIYYLGSLPPFLLVLAGNIKAVDHRWNQHGLGGDNIEGKCRSLHPGPISLLHWSGKGKPWLRLDSRKPCTVDHLWAPYDLYRSSRHVFEERFKEEFRFWGFTEIGIDVMEGRIGDDGLSVKKRKKG